MGESGFAHEANSHDSTGNAHVDGSGRQLLTGLLPISGQNLLNGMRKLVLGRIGLLAESLNLLQLFNPQLINVFVECQKWPSCVKVSCDYRGMDKIESLSD